MFLMSALFLAVGSGVALADENWRAAAAERIRQHRQTDAEIVVLDTDGDPVPGATVVLEMKRHAFLFGTAVNEPELLRAIGSGEAGPYAQHLPELFNTVVLENWMKWKPWEKAGERRAQTDRILDWFAEKNLAVRGHTMVWQCKRFGVTYPKDIERIVRGERPGTPAAVRERVDDHIKAAGQHFTGKLIHWDVVNEPTEWHEITDFLSPDAPSTDAPDLANWYRLAHEADPAARLYINDYHILVGDFSKQKDGYEKIIGNLIQAGAPLQGIGFQGHFHGGNHGRTPEQTLATLDRFAKFGLPMAITEFDAYGKGWGGTTEESEARQAQFLEEFLVACFSHPGVEAFLMWGFWDGAHWADCAPLFRKDWTPKPALEVWRRLVFDEWWTKRAEVVTTESGTAAQRVFNGDYELTIQYDEEEYRLPVRIVPGAKRPVFTLPKKAQP